MTLDELEHELRECLHPIDRLNKEIKELQRKMAATQADIDALTAQATAQGAKLQAIATAVLALEQSNPGLNIDALKAALTVGDTDISTIQSELPTSPTTPVTTPAA